MKNEKAISGAPIAWERNRYTDLLRTNSKESNIDIEFLKSENPAEIEEAISKIQRQIDFAREIIALAIYKLFRDGRYIDLGFRTREDYLRESETRLHLNAQQISDYYISGEVLYNFGRELKKKGYEPNKYYSKLRFFHRAYYGRNLPKREVINNFFKLSWQKYKEWVLTDGLPEPPNYEKGIHKAQVVQEGIAADGRLIISINDIQRIIDSGSEPYIVPVYDSGEKKAITNFLKKFRASK